MSRGELRAVVGTLAAVVSLVVCQPAARGAAEHRVWFTPDIGSPDMLRLFQAPDLWTHARRYISVFKFYQAQLLEPLPDPQALPNDYTALRDVDAFRKLTQQWHKEIAIEVGSVKPFYCTPDPSGMRASIRNTLAAIANVQRAGGRVDALAMDEPFMSGLATPACGAPDVGPTLSRLEQYMRIVHMVQPHVEVGLIEPYPYFTAAQLLQFLAAMRGRAIQPAFFHIDVDLEDARLAPDDFARDMKHLQAFCLLRGIRFGFIFWGTNTDSDAAYFDDVMARVQLARTVFGAWETMPDDLVFQSWAESGNGLKAVPVNLPEASPDTHTNLIDRALFVLSGFSYRGTAVPRR